jgi:CelD/BcsL family acetyltransferase involved in cellulose biosynthesis
MSFVSDLEGMNAPALNRQGPQVRASGLQVSEVVDRPGVLALEGAWRALEAHSEGSSAFQAFDLCLAWLDTYAFAAEPTHQARIVCVQDTQGSLVALAPLAVRIGGLVRMAEWIGEPLIQYGDILLDPDTDAARVRRALSPALSSSLPTWGVHGLHLRKVRADARVAAILDLKGRALSEADEAALADLTLFENAQAYFASFSKVSRKSLRRRGDALARLGSLSFHEHTPNAALAPLCDMALAWKTEWLREHGLSSRAFMDPRALATLKKMMETPSAHSPMRLYALCLDGKPIAIEISLVSKGVNMAFMGAFDPAYKDLSPGKLQMEASIRHGFAQGWSGYDLLAPMSEYKKTFANTTVEVADYLLPGGLTGLLYRDLYLRTGRPLMKQTLMALPSGVRAKLLHKAG